MPETMSIDVSEIGDFFQIFGKIEKTEFNHFFHKKCVHHFSITGTPSEIPSEAKTVLTIDSIYNTQLTPELKFEVCGEDNGLILLNVITKLASILS